MCATRLISFQEASTLLGGLHVNTIRERKGGTGALTHVRFGRRVFLIRVEVLALVEMKISKAQAIEQQRQELLQSIGIS